MEQSSRLKRSMLPGGVGGLMIELIIEDAPALDLKQGVSVAKKLMTIDNVLAIVGPQWDSQAEVVAAVAAEQMVPVISPNASTDIEEKIDSPYFFTTWPKNEVGVRKLLEFAQSKGWTKIAVVQPANQSFWLYTTNLLEKNAPEFGIEIVAKEMGVDYNTVDYRTLITKAKATEPNAFFGSYADLECVFLRQSDELKAPLPLLSTESAGTPKALRECPELMKDRLFFATPGQGYAYQTFEQNYEERFGQKPLSPSAATSYDAVLALSQVLNNLLETGQELTRDNIRNGLYKIRFESGVSMPVIEFDDKGFVITPPDAFEIRTVRNGQFVRLEN
jgi:branched-chain amino acid transport system substrate-binding protein